MASRKATWRGLPGNRERELNNLRNWVERNRSKINERRKMYSTNINRAARDYGLPGEFTVKDKENLLEYFGGCALTGESENIHLDHVIPITLGIGGTVDWNMIPLKAGLNISKGKKNIFEWFSANKKRFDLDQRKFDETIKYLADRKGVTVDEYKKFVYECYENNEL